MTKWFRFYADAMRNPKVAKLSDRDFRLWVQVLSVASENDGRIPAADDLKHMLRTRLDHLLTGLDRLISAGLIDRLGAGYEPHNWGKFQYKSDTSTDRVRRHRSERNVSETPPEADTEQRQKIEPRAQHTEPARAPMLYDRLIEAASSRGACHPNLAMGILPITDLTAEGFDLEADILPVIRDKARPDIGSWKFFVPAIRQRKAERSAVRPIPVAASIDWAARLDVWRQDGTWAASWGPKPGEASCRAPPELLSRAA